MNEANAMLSGRVRRKLITIMCRRKKATMQPLILLRIAFRTVQCTGDPWVTELSDSVDSRRHGLYFWPIEVLFGFRRFQSLSTLLCSFPAHAPLLCVCYFRSR